MVSGELNLNLYILHVKQKLCTSFRASLEEEIWTTARPLVIITLHWGLKEDIVTRFENSILPWYDYLDDTW